MERGQYLQNKIEEKGYNVMTLSKASGVAYTTIRSMIERNLSNASIDNVIKICKTLGIRIEDLQNQIMDTVINDSSGLYHTKEVLELPIVGAVACGKGVLAYQDIEGYEKIPRDWVKGAEHFLLRAKGDSMINARINDGDLLLIRQQEGFEQGEIMVVIIDEEAVLKKIYKTDGNIMLQSENPKYPPRFITSESDIRIIGKLKMNLISY